MTTALTPGFGTTNISILAQKSGAVFIERGRNEIIRLDRVNSIHIVTPLVVKDEINIEAKTEDGNRNFLGDYECEIIPQFDKDFSASRFPKQLSPELKDSVFQIALQAREVCTKHEDKEKWVSTHILEFQNTWLKLNFRFW